MIDSFSVISSPTIQLIISEREIIISVVGTKNSLLFSFINNLEVVVLTTSIYCFKTKTGVWLG